MTHTQMLPPRKLCVLCHCPMERGEGNNAWPITYGICCDDCDETYVCRAQHSVLISLRPDTTTMH